MNQPTAAEPAEGPVNAAQAEDLGIGVAKRVDRRGQRLVELLHEILSTENPLEANLGVVNCDLMEFAATMKKRLTEALEQQPATLDELDQLMRAMDQYLRITKQIDRYAQLGMKLREMRSTANLARPGHNASSLHESEESAT